MIAKAAVRIFIFVLIFAALLFGSSGRLDWVMGWVYFGLVTVVMVVNVLFIVVLNPELAAERASIKDDAKSWDKVVLFFMALIGAALWLVAGLDKRFGWSGAVPAAFPAVGLTLLVAGYALGLWAMWSNKFFSGLVRIQWDRGHVVVSSGPYRFIRHPAYAGNAVASLAVPLILGSWWALVPAGACVGIAALRAGLEDATLRRELPGYSEYAERVGYRLLPGVW